MISERLLSLRVAMATSELCHDAPRTVVERFVHSDHAMPNALCIIESGEILNGREYRVAAFSSLCALVKRDTIHFHEALVDFESCLLPVCGGDVCGRRS